MFTALIIEQAGFETVFIGGFGTSASMLGLPDLNFLTMSEMADAVRRMAARVCIPVSQAKARGLITSADIERYRNELPGFLSGRKRLRAA